MSDSTCIPIVTLGAVAGVVLPLVVTAFGAIWKAWRDDVKKADAVKIENKTYVETIEKAQRTIEQLLGLSPSVPPEDPEQRDSQVIRTRGARSARFIDNAAKRISPAPRLHPASEKQIRDYLESEEESTPIEVPRRPVVEAPFRPRTKSRPDRDR